MKRILIKNLVLFIITILPFTFVYSQSDTKDDRTLLFFIANDTVHHEIMGYFYRTQSPLFNDPVAPRFIVASKNQNFIMGLGGYVMLRMSEDFGGISKSGDFNTFDISAPNTSGPYTKFNMDAGSSRIFLKVIGNTKAVGPVTGYVEGDFMGGNGAFRLRQAYINLLGITAGQTFSTMVDTHAAAPTVDQNGSPALFFQRTALLRYEHNFKSGLGFAVAAEMPSFQVRYDHEKCKESPVTIPDFPLYLQFNKNGYHFRATGIIRNIPYQNGQNNTYHTEVCVGGRFTTALPITSNLRVYGAATYGKGMTSYIEDFHDEPMAFPNPNHLTELDAITVASYYGALKLNYTPRLYSSLTYSYCRRYMPDSTRDIMKYYGSAYKFGQAVSASLIWEFIPHAVCGVEYWYGKRNNLDKNDGHANRIYGMLRYNF